MKKIVLASVLAITSVAAQAKTPGSGPNPFSDCGIGAALFQDNKTLAVSSNIIWDIGTTAVTSATASPETCNGKQATAAKFIVDSIDSLQEDVAKGEGKHIDALFSILEVSEASKQAKIASLRSEAADLVLVENKLEQSQAFYAAVMATI